MKISKEELDLINQAKNGNENSLKEIISMHSGICMNTYKKYISPKLPGHVVSDLLSSKDYLIYNSIKSFDPQKGSKFSTWLSNQVRYYCLNTINKASKIVSIDDASLNTILENEQKNETCQNEATEERRYILNSIKETLKQIKNEKIKECVKKKYFPEDGKNKSFTDIAKEMGVTVQTVINWNNKFISFLKNKYNKKNHLTIL